MRRELKVDWLLVAIYTFFMIFGWFNIYAASTNDASLDIFNLNHNYGKQFVFICASGIIGLIVLFIIDLRDVEFAAYIVYGLTLLLLVGVIFAGREVNGAQAWFEIGGFRLQPSEFAKLGTILALAKYMSQPLFSWRNTRDRLIVLGMIALPFLLILKQGDTGTALTFIGFAVLLFREGLSPIYIVIGVLLLLFGTMALLLNANIVVAVLLLLTLGIYIRHTHNKRWTTHLLGLVGTGALLLLFITTTDLSAGIFGLSIQAPTWLLVLDVLIALALVAYWMRFRNRRWITYVVVLGGFLIYTISIDIIFQHILLEHQRARITALFNPDFDPEGINWNTKQSKIAIGSGGIIGKGYLEGTQTKFDFVPQQHTDFIFCTIGEEWGWVGSTVLLVVLFIFLYQMLHIAEETRWRFGRLFIYGAVGIFFIHITINIAMTIGLAPVIGIPLPFFSYGGSSLLSFSLMFFLALKYHATRGNVLGQ